MPWYMKGLSLYLISGGGAKYNNNIREGKITCTPINPKKYSCYGLKKNSYKEFDNVKKFVRLENSPPPPPP